MKPGTQLPDVAKVTGGPEPRNNVPRKAASSCPLKKTFPPYLLSMLQAPTKPCLLAHGISDEEKQKCNGMVHVSNEIWWVSLRI